jgi:formylglycine-generating enzyme required for sulfatase activity
MTSCCSPSREPGHDGVNRDASTLPPQVLRGTPSAAIEFVALEGGTFTMGDGGALAYPGDGEDPVETTVGPFELSATSVTNAQFSQFVSATGYLTEAERFEWSFVFGGQLPDDFEETRGVVGAEWWRQVYGATRLARRAASTIWAIIRSCMCRTTMRWHSLRGPVLGSRPKPNGSSLRVRAQQRRGRGATSESRPVFTR